MFLLLCFFFGCEILFAVYNKLVKTQINTKLAHFTSEICESHIPKTDSSIISISSVFNSPRSTAEPGGFNLDNFFPYPYFQNWHQISFLQTVQLIS